MATAGIALALLVLLPLIGVIGFQLMQGHSVSWGQIGLGVGICLIAFAFLRSVIALASRFVVHMEVWPSSNLVHLRTAGITSERIHLIPWHDFRTHREVIPHDHINPYLRAQLSSGRRLAFEHASGTVPHGWPALRRFIEKCHIPEAMTNVTPLPADRAGQIDPSSAPILANASS